jgi:hypothetical protein
MRNDLPVNRTGPQVRRRSARRSTPLLGSLQVLGLVVMVGSAATVWALSSAPQFAAKKLEIVGARFTSGEIVRHIVGLEQSSSLFSLQTDRAAAQLARLPAVVSARVEVRLPDTVIVTLGERTPRIVWVVGQQRYVADDRGVLFGLIDEAGNPIASTAGPIQVAPTAVPLTPLPTAIRPGSPEPTDETSPPDGTPAATPEDSPGPDASPSAGSSPAVTAGPSGPAPSLQPVPAPDSEITPGPDVLALPVVYDRRAADTPLSLGSVVDPIALDAGYRLACRTPAEIGSRASSLVVVVDDEHGFTISSVPAGWVAEFGFYTPTLRKVTVIPNQIGDLRSTLAGLGENHVAWVWLMADIGEDHLNSYWPR